MKKEDYVPNENNIKPKKKTLMKWREVIYLIELRITIR